MALLRAPLEYKMLGAAMDGDVGFGWGVGEGWRKEGRGGVVEGLARGGYPLVI